MNKYEMTTTVAGFTLAFLAITTPVFIVTTNSTARLETCVESGGQYLKVPNTTTMECRR